MFEFSAGHDDLHVLPGATGFRMGDRIKVQKGENKRKCGQVLGKIKQRGGQGKYWVQLGDEEFWMIPIDFQADKFSDNELEAQLIFQVPGKIMILTTC